MPAPRLQTHASPTPSAPDVVDTAAARSDVVEPLNLTPLLKAYDEALKLARHPPASLRLPRRLEAAHRALRLAVGCEYFATRTVRRRLDTLERALTVRAAIGEAADGDAATLDALRSFRGSLAPAPSRAWKVAGAIAVVVVAQAALGDEFAASTGAASLRDALRGLGLSPDVRSTGDLVTALTSGNLRMFEALTSAVLAIALLFGLPLGGGYRLAQMCLGQPGHAGSWRRTSPLCRRAAQLHTAQREAQAARSLGAELRREVPLDLFVKAALCAAVAFWLLDLARTTAPPQEYEGGALPAKSMLLVLVLSVLAVVPLAGRLTWRGRLISPRTSLTANVVLVLITCGLALRLALARGLGLSDVGTWVAIALALLLGLAWLSSRAIGRHQGSRWIVVPVAATLAAGMLASTDDALVPPDFRAHAITRTDAIEDAGLDAVPRLSRGDLQMLLLSRTRLADADLSTQDMHLLSLRERDLRARNSGWRT
ncbi:MAG: hypothetical protein QOG94_1082 [Solirubrobacteraceae bacterium]|nr:hypothetical protein [Solirubrobacteraceae bacterium]